MAGTIVADTLTHSTAGSIATNYVVDGSAKAWASVDMTGTASIKSSLNTSSLADNGTGIGTLTLTNALTNTDQAAAGGSGGRAGTTRSPWTLNSMLQTSSTIRAENRNDSGSYGDIESNTSLAFGDLA